MRPAERGPLFEPGAIESSIVAKLCCREHGILVELRLAELGVPVELRPDEHCNVLELCFEEHGDPIELSKTEVGRFQPTTDELGVDKCGAGQINAGQAPKTLRCDWRRLVVPISFFSGVSKVAGQETLGCGADLVLQVG